MNLPRMGLLCIFTLGLACNAGAKYKPSPLESEPLPRTVKYNAHDVLQVDLNMINVPPAVIYYEIYVSELSTKAQTILKHDWMPKEHVVSFSVPFENTEKNLSFEMTLKSFNGVKCNKRGNRKFLKMIHTYPKVTDKECLNKSCIIPLDWNNECENHPATEHELAPTPLPPPEVTPKHFRDMHLSYAIFSCTAPRHGPRDVLVWYQEKDSESEPIVLKSTVSDYQGAPVLMQAILNKTLTDSDSGSVIYCVKRILTRNKNGESIIDEDGVTSLPSQRITLSFSRNKVTPKVNVVIVEGHEVSEPDSVIEYEPGSTLEFDCSSTLVDGCNLTWYEEELDVPTFQRTFIEKQTSEPTTNNCKIALHLNESRAKRIYCIQERPYHKNGTNLFSTEEMARSKEIILRPRATKGNYLREHRLMLAGASVAAALGTLLVAWLVLAASRARRRPATDDDDKHVPPQITYAVLDLPPTGSDRTPKKREKPSPYVKIVGVYKNKMNKK